MSTTDEGVCAALIKCSNFVKSVLAMLQSLIPELVHRALIIVLNVLSMDSTVSAHDAAVMLCEGQLLPVVSVVIEEMKGKTNELVLLYMNIIIIILLLLLQVSTLQLFLMQIRWMSFDMNHFLNLFLIT